MFVDKNILASAIAEGKDPESIAQELIAALNEAIVMNREAEQAKKAEEAKRVQLESAGILLAAFISYVEEYCPNMTAEMAKDEEEMTPEDIVVIMDQMDATFGKSQEVIEKFGKVINDFFTVFDPEGKVRELAGEPNAKPLQVEPGTTPVMPVSLANFLKEHNL